MANLKAALIGCGGMGRAHANAGQALGVDVVAFCDVIESAAESAREEFGGRYATTDAGRIMRDDSIDLLYIATHHDAHHPLAIAGAQAGKHMMLEKPMCIMRHQAVEVAEAVEKAGCQGGRGPLVPHPAHDAENPRADPPIPASAMASWRWKTTIRAGLARSGCGTRTTAAACWSAPPSIPLTCSATSWTAPVIASTRKVELFEPEHKGTAGYPDVLVGHHPVAERRAIHHHQHRSGLQPCRLQVVSRGLGR